MDKVFTGRYSAHTEESFVVFLIGVSINRVAAIHRWFPVVAAMPPMLKELASHPEKGMLSSRVYVSWPAIMVVQYWRSFDDLEAFARNPNDLHLPAWRRFNQALGKSDIVGIFHETFKVQAGQYEAVYVNMPRFGLAIPTEHIQALGKRETARGRLGGDNTPAIQAVE